MARKNKHFDSSSECSSSANASSDSESDSSYEGGGSSSRKRANKRRLAAITQRLKQREKRLALLTKKLKKRKHRRRQRKAESEEESEFEDDDDEEEDDEEEDDDDDESSDSSRSADESESIGSDDDAGGSDTESATETDGDSEINMETIGRKRPLIILMGTSSKRGKKENGGDEDDDEDDEEEETQRARKRRCITSEDERNFMKETYVDSPQMESDLRVLRDAVCKEDDDTNGGGGGGSSTSSGSKNTINRKRDRNCRIRDRKAKSNVKAAKQKSKVQTQNDFEGEDVSAEYKEVVELQRDMLKRLQRSPSSAVLKRGIRECQTSIKDLVRETRERNTQLYGKILQQAKKKKSHTHEVDYFRMKMSNKEQIKIIRELNEVNKCCVVEKPYRLQLLDTSIPLTCKALAFQRLDMLSMMDPSDSEYFKLKFWIDAFMQIPFGKYRSLNVKMEDGVDVCHDYLVRAKAILDKSVYGLEDAKIQVLQMLGNWITSPTAMGTAIAIKGPMGTGKTSLAKEGIAKIYGREFAYIPLGGASDSAYLTGHSYTYEGSMYGRIVQMIMDCKVMNPIIYFDELDKVSDSPRGEEIINVLIHLTDPTQNAQFHDRYFSGISLDLSRCMFVFSYNDENKVSPILRDRMYVIQTKKYDVREKVTIANEYLLPRIRQQVNFNDGDIVIPDETIQYIINKPELTKQEEGVRNLKRCLEILHTKLNLFRLLRPEAHASTFESLTKAANANAADTSLHNPNRKQIQFPFTISRRDVDALITVGDSCSPILSMYI